MKRALTLSIFTLLLAMLLALGCSPKADTPTTSSLDPSRTTCAEYAPCVFICGITDATSYGKVKFYNGVMTIDTGYYGMSPKLYGDWIYFIETADWYYPITTEPVKLNIYTGEKKSLGTINKSYDNLHWLQIDVANNGYYLTGKYSSFNVYNANGTKVKTITGYGGNFNDDGTAVAFTRGSSAYIQKLTSYSAKYISGGYAIATNGTKAVIYNRVGYNSVFYFWNGTSLAKILDLAVWQIMPTLDMDMAGNYAYGAGDLYLNGAKIGVGGFPAIKNGIVYYANGRQLKYYDYNTNGTIGSFSTAVQQID